MIAAATVPALGPHVDQDFFPIPCSIREVTKEHTGQAFTQGWGLASAPGSQSWMETCV